MHHLIKVELQFHKQFDQITKRAKWSFLGFWVYQRTSWPFDPANRKSSSTMDSRTQWHWVLESIYGLGLPLVRSNSQKLPLCSQNLKNDHFALLVIWSNFLWNCDPNFIKWLIWVHNVDVGQNSWGLTVNWPQLTFSPIQLISRSTVQLTGQSLESRLETWYG